MKKSIGVLGAYSYTGCELLKFLCRHPDVEVVWLTSESSAGKFFSDIFPQYKGKIPGETDVLKTCDAVKRETPDLVFSCLPHGVSAAYCRPFIQNGHSLVIDLSADFRLKNPALYEKTYGVAHPLLVTMAESVYGLSELAENSIRRATVVGNPGCYPTSLLLPLLPLLQDKLIRPEGIIMDSKSGVSGAGKKPTDTTHFINCNESITAYKIGDSHRHLAEIREQMQGADKTVREPVFTPHLTPMERGILSTIYCDLSGGASPAKVEDCLRSRYASSSFVHLVDKPPRSGDVCNTNNCHIHPAFAYGGRRLIIVSVIDNLVKGASGQALQNMNILFGFPQTRGLL